MLEAMGNLYGKPKPQPAPILPVTSMEEQLRVLEKRKVYTESRINHATEQAKACIQTNDKSGAERWLRQIKGFRTEQKNIYAMMEKLDALQGSYQQARIARDVLRVTESAAGQIRGLGLNADKADDIMDRARDAIADVEDVNRVMAGPLSRDVDVSDELAQLEAQTVTVHAMPEPPVNARPPTPPMLRELREAIPA